MVNYSMLNYFILEFFRKFDICIYSFGIFKVRIYIINIKNKYKELYLVKWFYYEIFGYLFFVGFWVNEFYKK